MTLTAGGDRTLSPVAAAYVVVHRGDVTAARTRRTGRQTGRQITAACHRRCVVIVVVGRARLSSWGTVLLSFQGHASSRIKIR